MNTHTFALLTFRSGATATLVTSYDSGVRRNQLEFYGSAATLQVPDPNHLGGDCIITDLFGEPEVIRCLANERGRGVGVVDLARAIRTGTPGRASGAPAARVLDVLLSIEESVRDETAVLVESSAGPVEYTAPY